MVIMKGLYKRKDKSQFYGVRRVIPARLRHLMDNRTELKASLGTADYNEALSKAPAVWLDFANAIAKGLDALPVEKPRSLTFADLFERDKEHVKQHESDRAENRIIAYTTSANRFIEFIGKKAVEDITVADLADFRNLLERLPSRPSKAVRLLPLTEQTNAEGEKISSVRVENILKELSSIFRVAVEDRKLTENPLSLASLISSSRRPGSSLPISQT